MKNNNPIFAHTNEASTIIMTIALFAAVMVGGIGMRVAISGVAVCLVVCLYILRGYMSRKNFSELAIARLCKAGLVCKKSKDGITVQQGDFIMDVKLWDNGTRGMKRVCFMLKFAPTSLEDVRPEGWALLAAKCNATYDYTAVKFYGDHFSCMVGTSVKNTKDLLVEYRFAFEKINETMQGMQANAEKVAGLFPAKQRKVGFRI